MRLAVATLALCSSALAFQASSARACLAAPRVRASYRPLISQRLSEDADAPAPSKYCPAVEPYSPISAECATSPLWYVGRAGGPPFELCTTYVTTTV